MNYWIWIMPILVGMSIVGSYANSEYNRTSLFIWYWVSIVDGIGLTILWPFVAKYSTDLVRDNLIWAVSYFFCSMLVLLSKGHFSSYTISQWFGFVCVIVGFILLQK